MSTDQHQQQRQQRHNLHALRTQREVAEILTARGWPITKGGVFMAEQRAFKKIRDGLAEIAADYGLSPDPQD